MGIEVRGLATVRSLLGALHLATRVPVVTLTVSAETADKLRWLARDGRDVEETNRLLLEEMTAAAQRGFDRLASGASADPKLPWELAGEAYLRRVAARIAAGGGDVRGHMRPLQPETVRRKGHSRIGVDSGDMLRDMLRARVVVVLRGPVVLGVVAPGRVALVPEAA